LEHFGWLLWVDETVGLLLLALVMAKRTGQPDNGRIQMTSLDPTATLLGLLDLGLWYWSILPDVLMDTWVRFSPRDRLGTEKLVPGQKVQIM